MFKDLSFDSSSRGGFIALRETISSFVYYSFHRFQDALIDCFGIHLWNNPYKFSCVLESIFAVRPTFLAVVFIVPLFKQSERNCVIEETQPVCLQQRNDFVSSRTVSENFTARQAKEVL